MTTTPDLLEAPAYPPEFEESCRWYSRHLSVVDETGNVRPFVLRHIQKELEYEVWKARQATQPCFLVIVKARRAGISTWAAARFYRDARENNHHRNMIMAQDAEATRNILSMVRFFYESDKKAPGAEKDSAAALAFDNGSEFFIYPAGARGRAARSFNAQGVHFTELAHYPDPDEVFTAVMQVTPNTYPALVIIESTAIGPGDALQRHYDRAAAGTSGFTARFFAWHEDERYTRPLSYEDLIASAPRAWVENSRAILKRERDALGKTERAARSHARRTTKRSGQRGRGSPPTTAGPESTSQPPLGTTLEGEGPRGGGRLPDPPLQRPDDPRPSQDGRPGGPPEPEGESLPRPVDRAGHTALRLQRLLDARRARLSLRFDESMTEYEQKLKDECRLSCEQINWLRWIRGAKCLGDETRRMREYPSRLDEAFSAASEVVLDPVTLARWIELAEEENTQRCHFALRENDDGSIYAIPFESNIGETTLFELPLPDETYVMGVDPSSGVSEGDWQVACVLKVSTGEQVAEFRGKLLPDVAIDQIEALGTYYNKAFTGCEANSIGLQFARAFADRGSFPCFEREVPDREEPWKKTKMIGWLTGPKTRDSLISEVRMAFREGKCRIRSMPTLLEGKTLVVNRSERGTERIEAREDCHDDGIFAYGIALIMRNRQSEPETAEHTEIRKDEVPELVQKLLADFAADSSPLPLHRPKIRHVNPGASRFIDQRRSVR